MPIRSCPAYGQRVLFEARVCDGCASALGFEPELDRFLTFDQGAAKWSSAADCLKTPQFPVASLHNRGMAVGDGFAPDCVAHHSVLENTG